MQTFTVRYDVKANAPITKVRVMLDNQMLDDFAYANAGNQISDIKKVNAPMPLDGNAHSLTIIATDAAGRYNRKTIAIQGADADTNPPYLVTDTLVARKRTDGKYDVIMLFVDDLSAIK